MISSEKRFIVSRAQAEAHREHVGNVVIHDHMNLTEECNTDQIEERIEFGDLVWGLAQGWSPCGHCLTQAGAHP